MRLPHGLIPCAVLLAPCAPLSAQTNTLVSVCTGPFFSDGASEYPSVSGDGRYVAFLSYASNLVPGDTNTSIDIFVRDVLAGTTTRVSVNPAGGDSNNISYNPRISANGRYVAFQSLASNLVAGDTNGGLDVFVRDLVTNTTVRASVSSLGSDPNLDSHVGSISADGRFVVFTSYADNLVAGDTNSQGDVFVRDLVTGQTTRASVSSAGIQGNSESGAGTGSDDGRYVAFYSWATNFVTGDTNGMPDVFVRDMSSSTTTRVSVSASGVQANNASYETVILSADGRFVVFKSYATNLVSGDTNAMPDFFERDLLTGAIERVNVSSLGVQANDYLLLGGVSADGRHVVMSGDATSLVPNDTNNRPDVFVHDRLTGATTRVDLGPGQVQSNGATNSPAISSDGRFVAFTSAATNLTPGDTNTLEDILLRDRASAPVTAFCFGDGTQATPCPCANSGVAGHGCDNSSASGGAQLSLGAFGGEPDSATLSASGIVPGTLTIFLQGNAQLAGSSFGDGVRCVGGALKRLYVASATGGVANAPTTGGPPLGSRSAALGDPIASGSSRWYQAWYRDADASYCAAPQGDLWNVSNGVRADW